MLVVESETSLQKFYGPVNLKAIASLALLADSAKHINEKTDTSTQFDTTVLPTILAGECAERRLIAPYQAAGVLNK